SNWLKRLPAGSITTWEDLTTHFLAQFFPPGRIAKLLPHHGLDLWLQVQIFYDHIGCTTQMSIDYAAVEMSLNYENPNIEQLLGIMKRKVNTLIGRSESIFRMTTNEMYQPPSEPSRQKEFEDIVMNIILDQEERVEQLKEYMKVIIGDFMQLSLEVTRGLKEKIREEGSRIRKFEKITKYQDIEVPEPLAKHKISENPTKKSSSIPSNLSP
ncbi:hypothetical protein Tco_1552476, partial [Tanacetum coccineum]